MISKEKIKFYLYDDKSTAGKAVDLFLIIVNIMAIIHYIVEVETVDPSKLKLLFILEIIFVSVFIAEYMLRLLVAENKRKFVFSVYSFFDILSIIPIAFTIYKIGFLRILRVFRILRFQKYLENEYFFFGRIKPYQLQVMRLIFIIITIVLISAGFIYSIEGREGTNTLKSFLDAVYFTVSTVTTVGFGDFTPSTNAGKLVTIGIILSGVLLLPYSLGRLIKTIIETKPAEDAKSVCSFCHHANPSGIDKCEVCQKPLEKNDI